MIEVDEALTLLDAAVPRLAAETVATTSALGRVLTEPVAAPNQIPLFDQSAVDGYAVRAADIATTPATLPLGPTIAATSHTAMPTLPSGQAARIFTGGLLPDGADTVVRQELTRPIDGVRVEIREAVVRGTDIRRAGEELAAGFTVAESGATITPGLLGAIAFVGAAAVSVSRLPRVRVFVTGDEVVPLGARLRLGEVPDANGPLVAAHLSRWGITDVIVEHLVDDSDRVRAVIDQALGEADLVITTGGVSVGDYDFIPSACDAVGARRVFWKVAQKPGMPLFVAERDGAILMGLPGNPGAVLVNLHVYVRRAIDRMVGSDSARRWERAAMPAGVRAEANKTFWLRARAIADERGVTTLQSLTGQASHMLANLATADALVRIPGDHENQAASGVAWTRLTP